MIHHVLREADRASRLSIKRERDLTKILRVLGSVMMWPIAFNVMVDAAGQDHPGLLSAVDKDDSAVMSEVRAVL